MFRKIYDSLSESLEKNSIPDAILVSGKITGEAASMSDLRSVKEVLPNIPVLANTGVKQETLEEVLKISDGCIVGSSLKFNGDTWQPVDPKRANNFMHQVKILRASE